MDLLRRRLTFSRDTIAADAVAGLTSATAAIPDAIASAILAGVNPIHGLYALMVATPVAAVATSSVFMNVSITSAMAFSVGDALGDLSGGERVQALVVLTVLVGVFQLLLGVLKLGGLIRFVSNAVMTGFLVGLAVLIVLGQLGDLTGYNSAYSNKVMQALDLLLHLDQVHVPGLIVGAVTVALILLLGRTPLRKVNILLALIAGAAMVPLLGWETVALIGDASEIPRSLPIPALPNLSLISTLIGPAVAVGIIGLVQAAGVSQSYRNPDGKLPSVSGDFAGQGIANMATGLLQGMPAGGSLSGTALVVNTGARTRWANILTGLFVIVVVLLFGNLVELLPVPALAGLLIYVGMEIIARQREEVALVWRTSPVASLGMIATFAATLVVPLVQAIYLGVVLSLLLHIHASSLQVRVVRLAPVGDDDIEERAAPAELPSNQATVLQFYGSAYFAAVSRRRQLMPSTERTRNAVVILNLRREDYVGSTYLNWLEDYADELRASGNRLMLADVGDTVRQELMDTGVIETIGAENVFPAKSRLGASTYEAVAAAKEWIRERTQNGER
jgi:SulP family sulfate permease